MPIIKKGEGLHRGMRENPVVFVSHVDLDARGVPEPTDEELAKVFDTKGAKLKTWNRTLAGDGKRVLDNDVHWLGVRRGTPMHNDTAYPRYTHQLKVRVDPGVFTKGLTGIETPLRRGTFYILDTHSWHQVFHKERQGAWNISASIDHHAIIPHKLALSMLLNYVQTNHILDGIEQLK